MTQPEKVTQSEAASRLGLSPQAIGQWVRRPGAPVVTRRGVAHCLWPEFPRWREQELARQVRDEGKSADLAVEQARKMKADADLAELKRDQMRGDLVPAGEVEQRQERLCAYVRARVLSVRGKWAPKVLGLGTMAEATAVLDALASDVLAALREQADELDDDDPNEEVAA